jgi:peptide deformylase
MFQQRLNASFRLEGTLCQMLANICTYGDPVLHTACAAWNGGDLDTLVQSMKLACFARGGVGIAAPQIGVGKQVFVAHLSTGPIVAVNPVIATTGSTQVAPEGCLSVPGAECHVARFAVVELKAFDELMRPYEMTLSGWDARIIQHEFDHLRGVLITDL